MYYIPGYHPKWLVGRERIQAVHGERLAALAGRRLSRVWLLWNLKSDAYFGDGPVIMDFEGVRVEICHQRINWLSITWGGIDPAQPLEPSSFRLGLRGDNLGEMDRFVGQVVAGVELLEWIPDDASRGNVAVHIDFGGDGITIYNRIDSTEMSFGVPDSRYDRHRL
ncbi:hypothetical protein ACQEVF_40145 [Nonomuraea polychroma]|uniref:hypothetical protein n=1 Tax=Nonomuraea polychroma TaxID=46176 RepID=UPI003D8F36E5